MKKNFWFLLGLIFLVACQPFPTKQNIVGGWVEKTNDTTLYYHLLFTDQDILYVKENGNNTDTMNYRLDAEHDFLHLKPLNNSSYSSGDGWFLKWDGKDLLTITGLGYYSFTAPTYQFQRE